MCPNLMSARVFHLVQMVSAKRTAGKLVLINFLYRMLKKLVAIFFNILNLLLAGNLPPLGGVCVIVEDQKKYLLVERPEGGYVFPGGFMRWQEHPTQTALRECLEETGLRLQIHMLIGCSSNRSEHITRMSTLTVIYLAEAIDGGLKNSIEGRACWVPEADVLKVLQSQQKGIFEHFTRYREQLEQVPRFQV
jgi:ADP-ribose pyrophosphatase YjhB (NUDIX family)